MPITCSRLSVNRSAYMWMERTPRPTRSSISSSTFSGERKRTELPYETCLMQKRHPAGQPRLVTTKAYGPRTSGARYLASGSRS
jgi:hypothetical protein